MATQVYTPQEAKRTDATKALRAVEGGDGAGGGKATVERASGRNLDTFRAMHIQTGQQSQASGSAYVQVGGTKVVCSVYGPRSYSRASTEFSSKCVLNFDVTYAPFACAGDRRERGQQDDEREMSLLLGQVLSATVMRHKYPKSAVDVFVMVLEDDGGALGAAITAASLSFVDAGIELLDIVTACTVGSYGGELVLDPTQAERALCASTTTMSCMCSLGEVTYAWHSGEMTVDEVTRAMSLCLDGCTALYKLARKRLLEGTQAKAKLAAAKATEDAEGE